MRWPPVDSNLEGHPGLGRRACSPEWGGSLSENVRLGWNGRCGREVMGFTASDPSRLNLSRAFEAGECSIARRPTTSAWKGASHSWPLAKLAVCLHSLRIANQAPTRSPTNGIRESGMSWAAGLGIGKHSTGSGLIRQDFAAQSATPYCVPRPFHVHSSGSGLSPGSALSS